MGPQTTHRTSFWILTLLISVFLLPIYAHAAAVPSANVAVQAANIQIERANDNGLQFQLDTPTFQIESTGKLHVVGLDNRVTTPGAPDLPYYVTMVALPPQAEVSVVVTEGDVSETAVSTINPVPQLGLEELDVAREALEAIGINPEVNSPHPMAQPDPAIYSQNALYPLTNYEVTEPMYARDIRLVELRLYPVRYNPITQTIRQARNLTISITFSGAQFENAHPADSYNDAHLKQLDDLLLNGDQAHSWRSLPDSVTTASGSKLPVGVKTYKIEVNQDGIYEVSGAQLAAAGMSIGSINPSTIEMLNQGETVAYQFIDNNNNNQLNSDDVIRFYGKAFDGSRWEKMFVTNNVYWLWAGGTASTINSVANSTGSGYPVVTDFMSTVTKEPEVYMFTTWTDQWDTFPNDADNYYWDFLRQLPPNPASSAYEIDLPNPSPSATTNTYLLEIMTRENPLGNSSAVYTARGYINDYGNFGEETWSGRKNLNIVNTVPGNQLLQPGEANYPGNEVKLWLDSENSSVAEIYLNRITVKYLRNLVASENELIFTNPNSGNHEFSVSGFSEGNANKTVVWDVTNPNQPTRINMTAQDISGAGPYTYKIGRQHGNNVEIIATTSNNVKSVVSIDQYIPKSIDPPGGDADWLAISHANFISAANQLANHRGRHMDTFVVDAEEVINQYGYGLNTPAAIQDYLVYALGAWDSSPSYVTLVGDATTNPRYLDCPEPSICNPWNTTDVNYVVTDIQFKDRWQGLIPTDFTMSTIVGNDLLPDLAIGRLPSESLAEANNMVAKIIKYEDQRSDGAQGWQQNFLFVADDTDAGGDFCAANQEVGQLIPANYNQVHLCLPAPTEAATNALRAQMSTWINDTGVSVLNYRGHGSVQRWAGTSSSPPILSTDNLDFWLNVNRTPIILSADCLDGQFARPGLPGLGETFMKDLQSRGSVAHWSSAGLGFTYEHTILLQGLYTGLFDQQQTAIGDAVNAGKNTYLASGNSTSELYSFILLADPAMQILSGSPAGPTIYMPAIFKP